MQTCVLLSIKPEFAEAILCGEKKFEFRKVMFQRPGIERVIIYASDPTQKVVGEFEIEEVIHGSPGRVWEMAGSEGGVSKTFFSSYYGQRKVAYALKIRSTKKYRTPLELSRFHGNIRPPQSFVYLASSQMPQSLRKGNLK
jgi:predicted transcriptional regulator